MMRNALVVGVLAAAWAASAASPASAAQASASEYECSLSGVAGHVLPDGIGLLPAAGTYSVSGTVICTIVTGASVPVRDVGTFISSGSYSTLACTSGTWRSGGGTGRTSLAFPAGSAAESIDMTYAATIAGIAGPLDISEATGASGTKYQGTGAVSLIPSAGDCLTAITQFQVLGEFYLGPRSPA